MNVTRLVLCGVVGLGLGACVSDGSDAPMLIIGNVAPGANCSVDSASTSFQDDGLIESDSVIGYVLTPAVRNDLELIGDEPAGPKTIYITHAHVHLEFYDPDYESVATDSSLLDFNVPVSAVIEPNGGTAGMSFEIVPPELLAQIQDKLLTETSPIPRTVLDAQIRMVGTRGGGGGGDVLSNIFRYPVEVCLDCLTENLGSCTTDVPSGFMASAGGACNVPQDGVLQCCVADADNTFICPATHIDPPI